jgi:uncharacterized protein YdhG (YjbR/CyaY superfamily)
MERPTSVASYLRGLPREQRAALDRLREVIRSAAPDATEGISYSMAAFTYGSRGFVCYAAFKDHYSLFPMSKQVIADTWTPWAHERPGKARSGSPTTSACRSRW